MASASNSGLSSSIRRPTAERLLIGCVNRLARNRPKADLPLP
ncbi:hypothetical protein [Lysobacter gummosus]